MSSERMTGRWLEKTLVQAARTHRSEVRASGFQKMQLQNSKSSCGAGEFRLTRGFESR